MAQIVNTEIVLTLARNVISARRTSHVAQLHMSRTRPPGRPARPPPGEPAAANAGGQRRRTGTAERRQRLPRSRARLCRGHRAPEYYPPHWLSLTPPASPGE